MTYQQLWDKFVAEAKDHGFLLKPRIDFKDEVVGALTAPEKEYFSAIANIYFKAVAHFDIIPTEEQTVEALKQ